MAKTKLGFSTGKGFIEKVDKAKQADSATSASSASSATKATNDGNGNNISSTYYKKTDTVANATNAENATKATNADKATYFAGSDWISVGANENYDPELLVNGATYQIVVQEVKQSGAAVDIATTLFPYFYIDGTDMRYIVTMDFGCSVSGNSDTDGKVLYHQYFVRVKQNTEFYFKVYKKGSSYQSIMSVDFKFRRIA